MQATRWQPKWAAVLPVVHPLEDKAVDATDFNFQETPSRRRWVMGVSKVAPRQVQKTPWVRATIRRTRWAVVTQGKTLTVAVVLAVTKILTVKAVTQRILWGPVMILPTRWAVVTRVKILTVAVVPAVTKILTLKAVTLRTRWGLGILVKTLTVAVVPAATRILTVKAATLRTRWAMAVVARLQPATVAVVVKARAPSISRCRELLEGGGDRLVLQVAHLLPVECRVMVVREPKVSKQPRRRSKKKRSRLFVKARTMRRPS
jgi:hypothetical protein